MMDTHTPAQSVTTDSIAPMVPGGTENIQDIYPLSPLQEGMLFLHVVGQLCDTYVLSTLFELQSPQQVPLLTDALRKVIRRHDALRTAVLWERLRHPVQVVYREATLEVQELHLDAARDPIEQLLERTKPGAQAFELGHAPLVRLRVAASSRGPHSYALLQLHHIICDYEAWNTVVSEVLACLQGRERDLPHPIPYRNHVAWALQQARTSDAEAFFRSKLHDVTESTAPWGLIDIRVEADQVEEASRALDPGVAQKVRNERQRSGTSAARLFHAAYALVVAQTSGREDDVVYGTVLRGSHSETRSTPGMLGLLVNTLPLRVRLQDLTVQGLLTHTHVELRELLEHVHTPLTLAQHCSGLDSTTPLFTALLNYRRSDSQQDPPAVAGVRVVGRSEAWTNYPVALTVDDLGKQGFVLRAQIDRRVGAHRLMQHVETAMEALLDALEHHPHTPALSLRILPRAEWLTVIRSFNSSSSEHCYRDKTIHELFEEQAARTPFDVAVMHGPLALSYEDLNDKANQLARHLRACDVRPDDVVAILLKRGLAAVVALLGVLKAGAAYLPLDPHYPSDRLQHMIDDARPRALLTQGELKDIVLPASVPSLDLDLLWQQLSDFARTNLSTTESGVSAKSLLYVIYTSGSTGRPKGTAMPHGSMANLLSWQQRCLPLRNGERVLQFAALSFDVAFQETFSTLCSGGTLVLLDESVRRDARALRELLMTARIERLFAPPVMLQALAEDCGATNSGPLQLRDVIVAGEQLRVSPQIVEFFRQLPGCTLHNHYGPTETHVVTALTLAGDPRQWPVLPAIGRPISNTKIYILDRRGQPVPVAVPGEIYIGGANVARGYLHHSDLTAERFVDDPFHATAGARMYKTGDLGRWRADGTIEYLGRNDDQIKIRGFRVELGEIEARLAAHPAIKEAAVLARQDDGREKQLVAYVTLRSDASFDREALRTHLQALLPDYMVPSAFVLLASLPLTPSGKLNRRALPAPGIEAYASQSYEPPQGQVEHALSAIWRDLIGLQRIGRRDHFFRLGGNSLTSLRLVAQVAARLGVHLAAVAVFENPVLQDMAQAIEALKQNAAALGQDDDWDEGVIPMDDAERLSHA